MRVIFLSKTLGDVLVLNGAWGVKYEQFEGLVLRVWDELRDNSKFRVRE